MKQLHYIVFLIFILVSCGTNNSETNQNLSKKETDTLMKPVIDSMKTLRSIFDGDWYQASYIDSVSKTKSPFRSKNVLAEMVELSIDTGKIMGDSLEVGALGIHEGFSFILYFKQGHTSASLPTNIVDYDTPGNFSELGYTISGGDTSLILSVYNKDKKLIRQTQYLKAPENSEGGLQYMVNKALFAGSYQAEDSSGNISILTFTNDGRVDGLPGFKKYYVLTDFVADSENSVDEICFDIQTANQKCYGFIIKADTVKLYDVIENQDSSEFGELKYKMVKQDRQ